jgi:hypothetical protein
MTAEVAIMNKSAVALAADSKVTIGSAGGKTFDTVNKVFTLSKVHPVGLMIFGNAEFMRYPWETIVKLYRSEKGASSHRTISAWGDDFIDFVVRFGDIDDGEKLENFRSISASIFQDIRNFVRRRATRLGIPPNSPEYIKLTEEYIDHLISEHTGPTNVFSDFYMSGVKRKFGNVNREIANRFFSYGGQKIIRKALSYSERILQSNVPSPISSGIVIAGFGDKEAFPSLVHFETDGYIGNRPKILRIRDRGVTRENSAIIIPFAQKDMVCRFMEGIDPDYETFVNSRFRTLLAASCLFVLEKYGTEKNKNNSVRSAIVRAAQKGFLDHLQKTMDFQSENFSMPIVEMVAMLPKDELPTLAESLVSLTSLKRHVSSDAETVGGRSMWR